MRSVQPDTEGARKTPRAPQNVKPRMGSVIPQTIKSRRSPRKLSRYMRTSAAPQETPAPNAHMSTTWPSLTMP